MTDDPKRWVDDESALPAMREFLRDARLDAPTLDEETRRRVRSRIVPHTSPRTIALLITIVAAAAIVMMVFTDRGAPPPIAIDPGRDAGVDAARSLESIRMERTCGDEDVGYACTVQVEMARAYQRVVIHDGWGLEPPACHAHELSADAITRTSDTTLTIAGDPIYDPQPALRACAYDGDVLVASGGVAGTRSALPLEGRGSEDAAGRAWFDMRVGLGSDLDDDVTSFALVQQLRTVLLNDDGSYDDTAISCEGDVVAELPRAFVDAFDDDRLTFVVHVPRIHPEREEAFVVCGRDASGALTPELGPGRRAFAPTVDAHVASVITPSGDVAVDALQPGQRVLTRTGDIFLARTMPGPGFQWTWAEVVRVERSRETVVHRIALENDTFAALPSFVRVWSAYRHEFVALEDLHAGDVVATASGDVAVRSTTVLEELAYCVEPILGDPGSYFLDGLLVQGRHAHAHGLAPGDPPVAPGPVEAWPDEAYDCDVRATLEVRDMGSLRSSGASAVAIAYAPHRGPIGALQDVDCNTARIGFEASLDELALVPVDDAGHRRLSIGMSPRAAGDEDSEADCDAGFAVMACVRDASGLHAWSGARGRWTLSGPSCFAATTRIETSEGARPIASLRSGDVVAAYDAQTDRVVRARVQRLIPRGARAILAITLSSGAMLRVTAEHPLFDARSRSFRVAGSFAVGDALRSQDGADVLVVGIADGGLEPVFDVSVTGPHTFFAEGIVAHNY